VIPAVRAVLVSLLALASAPVRAAPAGPGTDPAIIAAARREGKVVVYASTDAAYAAPLLKDFRALHPEIEVDYNDLQTREVYNRFIAEVAAGAGTADLLWNSAMDLQMKLAVDGYAQAYESPEVAAFPSWATWRNQAFGTTHEPIVFVYNRRLLAEAEAPRSHADLRELRPASLDRLRGQVMILDPERSSLGFLLLNEDSHADPAFDETVRALGRLRTKPFPATGVMLERILSGEHLVGLNMIGSYALAKQQKDGSLAIVYPRDYTLVITRIALIPKAAKHPNAAKVFLDYLLSARGQDEMSRAHLFAIRPDVSGQATAAALQKQLGAALRPLPVSPQLLDDLDPAKRLPLMTKWQAALGGR
jgi:iron(III) transport system substrate-binding protein